MGGVAGGVAFIPAVPGLAPGAFMGPRARARGFYGSGGGVARAIEPALQASAGRMPVANVRRDGTGNPDPRKELRQMGGVAGGVAFIPAVPGLAPGACMGQGEGLPVRSSRPRKQAQAGCRSEACTE